MYRIQAEVNGIKSQVVRRNIDSPNLNNDVLEINDLGIKCSPDENGEIVVTLRLTPVR